MSKSYLLTFSKAKIIAILHGFIKNMVRVYFQIHLNICQYAICTFQSAVLHSNSHGHGICDYSKRRTSTWRLHYESLVIDGSGHAVPAEEICVTCGHSSSFHKGGAMRLVSQFLKYRRGINSALATQSDKILICDY